MEFTITDLTPGFAGEVSGIDITQPLTPAQAAELEAGMDRYAVLVYHDQHFTDEQQKAFSRNFGPLEHATGGNVTKAEERRLDHEMADVSNLGADHKPLARDDRRRLFNLGNQLWHSDSSFRAVPAKYSLLSGADRRRRRGQHRIRRHARRLRRAGRPRRRRRSRTWSASTR